jgi:hypothetical protein
MLYELVAKVFGVTSGVTLGVKRIDVLRKRLSQIVRQYRSPGTNADRLWT